MKPDYDLVVIGSSSAGLHAAVSATQHFARVALVLPQPLTANWQWHWQALETFLGTSSLATIAPEQVSLTLSQPSHTEPSYPQPNSPQPSYCSKALSWAETHATRLQTQYAPAVLASLGIDLVPVTAAEPGEFQTQPRLPDHQLQFVTPERQLWGRHYLLALDPPTTTPPIANPNALPYLTPEQLLPRLQSPSVGQNWVVVGEGPIAYSASQILLRLGFIVTLLMPGDCLFPLEDAAVSFWLQAQLEAEGGRLYPNIAPERLLLLPGRVQIGGKQVSEREFAEREFAAEQVLWCGAGSIPPNWLNLQAAGVQPTGIQFQGYALPVNRHLQTRNRQIFACGSLLGGYPLTELAHQEAEFILQHLTRRFTWQRSALDYRSLFWSLGHTPTLARVGLTLEQARRRYGHQVQVLESLAGQALLPGANRGFCQLVATNRGQILGATILGTTAREDIKLVTLAMRQRLPVSVLAAVAT